MIIETVGATLLAITSVLNKLSLHFVPTRGGSSLEGSYDTVDVRKLLILGGEISV